MNFLQYNIRGIYNNYSDLEQLRAKHNPIVIALQETHIKKTSPLNLIITKLFKKTIKIHQPKVLPY